MNDERLANAAYLTAWLHHAREVPRLAEAAGITIDDVAGRAHAEHCTQHLREHGVIVDSRGAATLTAEAAKAWTASRPSW